MDDLTTLLNDEIKYWIDTESVGRKYNGGLIKFEPRGLGKLKLSNTEIENLAIFTLEALLGSHKRARGV